MGASKLRVNCDREGEKARKLYVNLGAITLNYHASQLVKFALIRAMILEQGKPLTSCTGTRKRKEGETVAILRESGDYRYVYSFFKRGRMHDHSSVPFGYKLLSSRL